MPVMPELVQSEGVFNWTPVVPILKNVTCAFLHPKVSK